jgi:hypothetical protein
MCQGSGRAQAGSIEDKRSLLPIGLRLMGSIFVFIMIATVVMGTPVHWGRGGSVMPRWLGMVIVSAICTYGLKSIWTGITLADMREFYFNLRHPAQID